jgi:salicylate hydroxylase
MHDMGDVADATALSGAFGSGAAFAFEDAYVLAAALQDAHTRSKTVASALEAYDEVRIPRYADLVCLILARFFAACLAPRLTEREALR